MLRQCTSPESAQVKVLVEGREVLAFSDETVAAVLMRVFGRDYRNSVIDGTPRAPYCMIGSCFECLAEIDGTPNRQACLVDVRDGMTIARQRGRAEVR